MKTMLNLSISVSFVVAIVGCDGAGSSPLPATQTVCTTDTNGTFAAGNTIPGFALQSPTAGRADLIANGAWKNGGWTVMFTRAITTATNPGVDDADFAALGAGTLYRFSVAVMDNGGGSFDATMQSQNFAVYTLGNEASAANLKAKLAGAPPTQDPADANWGAAFTKPAGGGISGTAAAAAVVMRAAYDATNFYLLCSWIDATKDDQKQSWSYDGTTWTRRKDKGNDGSWATIDSDGSQWDEDRLAIWWNISVTGFDTEGCLSLCHDHRMGTHTLGEKADLWHWKAARTNPLGFADDQRLADDTFGGHTMAGRKDDTGTGLDVGNTDGANPPQPKYMAELDPGANARYLFLNRPDSRGVATYAAGGFGTNAVIPGFWLRAPSEGRADVLADGTWEGNQWRVMFTRSLTTSWTNDDRQFDALATGTLYAFSVAVLDNMGGSYEATMFNQNTAPYTLGDETLQPAANLKARKVTAAPSRNPNDTNWGPVFNKPAGSGIAGTAAGAAVALRAAYDASNIYILAMWSDLTRDDMKESWVWNGAAWTKRSSKGTDGTWATIDANGSQWDEDRLAIWWNISVTNFTSTGCMGLCHSHRMGTHTLGEKADLWHWKAARTNPLGFADDQRLKDGTWSGHNMAGRSDDTGVGLDVNMTANPPPYMAEGDPNANARYLLNVPTLSRRAVPFVNSGFAANSTLPGWMLRSPTGGRSDLRASGSWNANTWTVMFTRALTTPLTNDDRQFDALATGTIYPFSVAVLDNMGGAFDATMQSQNPNPFTLGNEGSAADLKAKNATPTSPTDLANWGAEFTKPAGTGIVGTATGAAVSLRASYDANNIYLLATWTDNTQSNLKESWVFDGANWTRRKAKGNDNGWATIDADGSQWDEDRLAIWWNINVNTGGTGSFATQGCQTLCHDHRMGSHTPGEKADLWHWKAARTNPLGFADDQRLNDGTWGGHTMAGRSDDTGTGIDTGNISAGLPAYMAEGDPNINAPYMFQWTANPWRARTFVNIPPVVTCQVVQVGGGTTQSSGAVSFSLNINPLLGANCPCHRNGGVQNGLNMDTYANLIAGGNSGSEVIPGNGAGSLIYKKVSMDTPPVGERMPFGGPYLTPSQQQMIKDWIDQGAQNN